jgi:competence protein ComEC
MDITTGYGTGRRRTEHHWNDRLVVVMAVCVVCAVWGGGRVLLPAAGTALATWWAARNLGAVLVSLVLVVVAGLLAEHAWREASAPVVGPFVGYATVVGDPASFGRGLRVVLDIEGRRYDAWVYGSPRRRLREAQAGERYYVQGVRKGHDDNARRAQARHVVGRFEVDVVGDRIVGHQLSVVASRLRGALRTGAERVMDPASAALYTGLVIGDDARQPPSMVAAFRTSGLSHLTAVSGQNVAFVLMAAGPLLRRLRPGARWAVTLVLVAWFATLTRLEPSVLRAGLMACIAATAHVLGRPQAAVRVLAIAVVIAVLLDPLLVWSVGFWLSVGATAGTVVVAPALAHRLRGPRWLALPLAVTLGAQVGVIVPSVLVFGRFPVIAVLANVLAVPVAGAVMLYGLPAGLLAGVCPPLAAVLLAPAEAGVRWVATVATLGARAQPGPVGNVIGWLVVAAVVLTCVRASPRADR